MPAHVLVHVAPATPTLSAGIRALRLAPGQRDYAGDVAFNLTNALDDPLSEPMAILANGRVIGYYRLDFAPRAVVGRDLGMPHAGVRAFCIDERHQGRGLGARAATAMLADLRRRHPEIRLVILTVHCSNRVAVSTYRRAGFVPTGELQPGGRAGPQYVMLHASVTDMHSRQAIAP